MAGDWIKMRVDLRDDPAVFKIAERLNIDDLTVIGGLFCFWSWADKHAVDGHVDGATSRLVDRVCCLQGFAGALVAVGWLVIDESGANIPKHERHNGESAKERAQKNARQARWRRKKAECVDADVDASPSTDLSTDASTREEKRREEKKQKEPPNPQAGAVSKRGAKSDFVFVAPEWLDSELFDQFIQARVKARKAPTEYAKHLLVEELGDLMKKGYTQKTIIGNAIKNGWQGFYEPRAADAKKAQTEDFWQSLENEKQDYIEGEVIHGKH